MTTVDGFRHQARITREVVRRNLDGVSHEESLAQPSRAGNCINWVVGHLAAVYDGLLPLLGQRPAEGAEERKRYVRGSAPITDGSEALPLEALVAAWEEDCERVDAGLAALPAERLAEPAPASPSGDPDETVGSLLSTVLFHQAYHAGQLGVLRRTVGRPGAIA